MRNKWTSRAGLIALLAISVTGAGVGCSDVDPINRVQPDYLKKADLVGPDAKKPYEWYIRNTVVDTTRSNSFAFPGVQDELKRVRWDIEEQHLIARKSYETVSGSDGHGADPAKNDGIIVASYPIRGHFDLQRDYNRSTGEENNVVVENSDRAWYDREYIRVDWTVNEVSDPEGLFWFEKIFGDVKFTTGEMVSDPASKFAPVYQTSNGYLDFTVKRSATTSLFLGIEGFPECTALNWFTGSDVMECNEQETAIRTSFMRVPDRDYEALETDSAKWAMFGTFNRDRWGFSRQYEILDKHWHRLVGRHNLWKQSHASRETACFNPAPGADLGQARKDADAKCAATNGKGSRCDMFAGETEGKQGYCTLPLAKREVKPVAYFVSTSMPNDLWDTNQVIVNQWNDGLVGAIAVGREVECRQDGGDKDSCHNKWFDGEKPKAINGPALVLCHNPTKKGDNAACGAEGTVAREGDLRYNLIGWVDTPLQSAPLGYGPNGADPLTGEVIQSTAYMYGASIDTYATMARDLLLVANGELDPAAFAAGSNITGSIGKFESTGVKELFKPYQDYLAGRAENVPVKTGMTNEQIAKAHKAVDASQVVARIGAGGVAGNAGSRLSSVNGAIAARGVDGQSGFGGRAEALARMDSMSKRLAGTQTETNLIGSADWMRNNAAPVPITSNQKNDTQLLANSRKASSPFGGALSPFQLSAVQDKINHVLEARGECIYGANEFNAPHFEGIAKKMAGKFQGDPQGLFLELRKLIYKGVTEHEIGHTMSMRHNFQGSWDSINFHPNYWKLRTKDGTATKACAQARAEGSEDTCMGPRYLDPETKAELGSEGEGNPGIEEFAYSSIMDYGYDFNSDFHGLGTYDRAMMKFVYGNAVETFQPDSKVAGQLASLHSIPGATQPRGHLTEQWWVKRNDPNIPGGEQVQPTHYTTLARIMQTENLIYNAERCRAPRADLGEDYSAVDGVVCAAPVKDHAHVSELQSGEAEKGFEASLYKTADGRIRWPYRFGTDEYANHPHNLRFDGGADVYEAATNVAKLYEYRYILDFFRRGRRGYLSWFIGNRLWGRYFSRFQSIGWLASSKVVAYSAMFPGEANNPALKSADWGEGYVLASNALFNTLKRSLLRPQPGGYRTKQSVPGRETELLEVPDFNPPTSATTAVSVLDGRWIDDDLNNAKGGSFHYQEYHDRAGTDAEKPLAFAALAAQFPPIDVYYSRDSYVDGRNMLLNFRSIYPQAYDRLMAGVLANDTDVLSAYATGTASIKAGKFSTINYADILDKDYKYAANARVIDPLVGFRLQVPALIYGLWFGEDDGTRSFQNSARVWIDGSAGGVTLPDADKVFFYEVDADGGSGVLWAARNFGTETVNGNFVRSKGIGHRMIHHANLLLAGLYSVQLNADGTPKYDAVTHRPLWEVGMEGKVRPSLTGDDLTAAVTEYKRYNGLLNVASDLFWSAKANLNGW